MWWQCNTLSRLYCTSSGLTGATTGLDTLLVLSLLPAYHGMQADGTCDVSEVLELCGGGAIHSSGCTAHPPGGQLRQKKCCRQRNSLFVVCCSPLNSIRIRLKTSSVPLRVLCGFQLLFPPIVMRIYYTSIYSFES